MLNKQKTDNLVESSGMITHFKATSILRKKDWKVLISPYYHDSISDSIRETDLIGEKQFYSAEISSHSSVQLNLQLFLECKYIKNEIVFWFDEINKDKAIVNLEKETDLRIAYNRSGDVTVDTFHYLSKNVAAKLFSTNSNKEDVVYKAMNQCLHSQIEYRKKGKMPILNKFFEHRETLSKIVQYPVIVCENFENLFEVKFDENGKFSTENLMDHFLLETNYRDDYFLIDVVDINFLETFLISLEKEAKQLISAYGFKQDVMSRNAH